MIIRHRFTEQTLWEGDDLRGVDLRGVKLTCASVYGGVDLSGANLSGVDLTEADFSDADLREADLRSVIFRGTRLYGAILAGADIRDARFNGAYFNGATVLPTGETWEQYWQEVVPALLTAGGRSLNEVARSETWASRSWWNCPISVAFGVHALCRTPLLHRPRIVQFLQFFDAGLIPRPLVPGFERIISKGFAVSKSPSRERGGEGVDDQGEGEHRQSEGEHDRGRSPEGERHDEPAGGDVSGELQKDQAHGQ